jgi:hypothetical protein
MPPVRATRFHRSHERRPPVPYDSIISRTDADSLIPQGQADAVTKAATQESAALTLFNRAQLSTKVTRHPVMSALPVAYWVHRERDSILAALREGRRAPRPEVRLEALCRGPARARADQASARLLTKLLTTPESVYTPVNENPLSTGGFSLELVGLEPTTSWVRSRRSPS